MKSSFYNINNRIVIIAFCLVIAVSQVCGASTYSPASITDTSSTHSAQAVSVLATKDQSGATNTWADYIEFDGSTTLYSGTFVFNIGSAVSISGLSLQVNYMGQAATGQQWIWELYLNAAGSTAASYVKLGDNAAATAGWASWTLLSFTASSVDFTRVLNSANQVQIRLRSATTGDNCDIDYVLLSLTTGAAAPTTATKATTAPTTATKATTAPTTATKATTAPTTATKATTAPVPATAAPAPATAAPAPATVAPVAPTAAGGGSGSTVTGSFTLKTLILAPSATTQGVDSAQLAHNMTGALYDVVAVSTSTSLSTYLATAAPGAYSGIITVSLTLSAAQSTAINTYQKTFGVKWVVLGSSPSGLLGLTASTVITATATLSLAPEFSKFATYLNPTVTQDTVSTIQWSGYGAAAVRSATISNAAYATAALMVRVGTGAQTVAAAQIKQTDGTLQLHFFVDQASDYLHSRLFSPLIINWLSPAQIFQGARRLTYCLQADDLLLGSFVWNTVTHTEPLSQSSIYRLTPDDLQQTSDYYDGLNTRLPAGSNVLMEWPFNGAGTTWYAQPDPLLAKAIQLQDKFWWLTHTWDHPCDLDTGTYDEMQMELINNINFTSSMLTRGGLDHPKFSKYAMVNPCITGLKNAAVLRSMVENGITICVGDNSVADYVPANPYHPVHTTLALNGYEGVLIIPREDLDIFYDVSNNLEAIDEYNTMYSTKLSFEDFMKIQVNYFVSDKFAFRHDPYMMHQVNGRMWKYADPVAGVTHNVSFITLWTDRVLNAITKAYSLPILSSRLQDQAPQWLTREAMDNCGVKTTVNVQSGSVVSLTVTTTNACQVGYSGLVLSGSTVTQDTVGSETTSWVTTTAGGTQTLTLTKPISL